MDIYFADNKLGKIVNKYPKLVQKHGDRRACLIRQRLDEMNACDTLAVLRTLPGPRCHELKQNRAGQLSVDLDHPYRLLFRPYHDPIPVKIDGGLDWERVTAIEIIGIEDTHE